ncbi:hypothetical protein ACOIDN_32570, partial [Klebsiella pneumoniae]|uniref:hypothetical protein n=1 Tax=Klebsiella pneumoniae TaxID=573 RepID=UPI003B5B900D
SESENWRGLDAQRITEAYYDAGTEPKTLCGGMMHSDMKQVHYVGGVPRRHVQKGLKLDQKDLSLRNCGKWLISAIS